jgi:asparagine N-glycosylation enzyme membrane subunit Stt3
MLLFSYKKKVEIQIVGNVLVVVVVVVVVVVFVVVALVVKQSGGSLVLRKDYHEGLCKWGETQMIVGVYDLDHLEKLMV